MKRLSAAVVGVVVLVSAAPAAASVEGYAWPHRHGHWPVVYVEDHTGNDPAWGVYRAVTRWSSGLRYGHCRPDANCIRVFSRREGADGYVGTAWHHTDGHRLRWVRIDLNDTYRYLGRAVTRQATKHELGHGLGLDHDPDGVMQPIDTGTARITRHERRELRAIYGVPR